jgi:hypothetical protein
VPRMALQGLQNLRMRPELLTGCGAISEGARPNLERRQKGCSVEHTRMIWDRCGEPTLFDRSVGRPRLLRHLMRAPI